MAVPPKYGNLCKFVRDILTKGYGFGLINLDLKTKSENVLEFTSSGSPCTYIFLHFWQCIFEVET
uniref:Uncharacterized protein n=2 Tax=Marmotini TaxID=337730 RepID=A0A8C9QFP0_SPEDA